MTKVRLLVLAFALSISLACSRKKPEALPVLGHVPAFESTDQGGKKISTEALRGHPWLAAFMFTRCPSVCPKLTARMLEVERATQADHPELRLVSLSVDPEFDTPEVLRAYAEKHHVDLTRWSFWTGHHQPIAEVAEQGFRVGLSGTITEGAEHLGITHGSHLILVDGQGDIRGYFRSFDDDLIERVTTALESLSKP